MTGRRAMYIDNLVRDSASPHNCYFCYRNYYQWIDRRRSNSIGRIGPEVVVPREHGSHTTKSDTTNHDSEIAVPHTPGIATPAPSHTSDSTFESKSLSHESL
eukprot:scaffold25925_cov59-Attheya_sp.AAC.6